MRYLNHILLLLLFACNIDEGVEPLPQIPVVEAFVYTGLPVEDVKVSLPYSYTDSTIGTQYLNDLDIYIEQNENVFLLEKPKGDKYSYSNSAIEVNAGDKLKLYFEYEGKIVSATSIVPNTPSTPNISTQYIQGPKIYGTDETSYWNALDAIELTWENEDVITHSYQILNLEPDTTKLTPLVDESSSFIQEDFPTILTDGTSINIRPEDFPYFSTYQISLLTVTDEYIDFIQSQRENEMNLTPAASNIENGQGIFATFSIWSSEVEVKQTIE
ncbi:DUF4249 family protein [Sediminitomix flava]|uniref:DUF4249 family protein n=1 Tax=Sediminitomix flava TaxID=379075 RepID=A0A315ZCA5_SEDFL|nr:hypothetical protein [Sediminitomix flava]PWJ42942.1 hypothetical protein BC781_102489 [Sediminitomix flava]